MVTGLRACAGPAPRGEWELQRACETVTGAGTHDGRRGV